MRLEGWLQGTDAGPSYETQRIGDASAPSGSVFLEDEVFDGFSDAWAFVS
jgi:hypothetical protein